MPAPHTNTHTHCFSLPSIQTRTVQLEERDAGGDERDAEVLKGLVLLPADEDAEEHDGHHLARLAQRLRRVGDVLEGLLDVGFGSWGVGGLAFAYGRVWAIESRREARRCGVRC